MTCSDHISRLCIKIADWSSHPIALALFPIICFGFLWWGGKVDDLTLILSVLAISLTQMVLRAQNIDAEATKLQIAELVKANPNARNSVIADDLTHEQMLELRKEIDNAISKGI